MHSALRLAAFAALALGAGCTEYTGRRDTLTLGSGEAVATNAALHTIDPWPRHAMRVDPYTDGDRMARAVERYRNPVSGPNVAVLPPVPIASPSVPPLTGAPGQP